MEKSASSDIPRRSFWYRVWDLYYDGFRNMTVGRKLWALIILKLFIIFVVVKLLFFPNILKRDYGSDEERANHVRHELMNTNK